MEGCEFLRRLSDGSLRDGAERWLLSDKNPVTVQEAKRLIEELSEEDLKEIFCKNLKFGTAGLRALMGAGFNRMNDVTVQQASQGLCAYLLKRHGKEECARRGIVIGCDTRHHSDRFSQLAAATFLCRGFKVYLFRNYVHTPLVPFSVLKLRCLAGVMVTASHNPKEYNGYKVYADNGVQIIPPVDADIARMIEENQELWEDVEEVFSRETGRCRDEPFRGEGLFVDPYDEMVEGYMADVSKDICCPFNETEKSNLKVVYSAMHGVGCPFVTELFKRLGFSKGLIRVENQCGPDPDFPSVPFPNPEEAGALNLSMEVADKNNSNLIICNDPDADRLACAEKCNGVWRQFTGDELGIILGAYMTEVRSYQGIAKDKMLFVSSIVSSKMLKSFAEANGCVFVETPTGFKWMGNKAAELESSRGLKLVLAYEEALGYLVTSAVLDKDGVSAAAALLQLACHLHAKGSCLTAYLAELRARYGHFVTNNGYKRATPAQQKAAMAWLCNEGKYHERFGPFTVASVRNVARGTDTAEPGGTCRLPRAAGDTLTLRFTNGATVTLRPSGTEPKLKWYAEVRTEDPEAATKELKELVEAVVESLPIP